MMRSNPFAVRSHASSPSRSLAALTIRGSARRPRSHPVRAVRRPARLAGRLDPRLPRLRGTAQRHARRRRRGGMDRISACRGRTAPGRRRRDFLPVLPRDRLRAEEGRTGDPRRTLRKAPPDRRGRLLPLPHPRSREGDRRGGLHRLRHRRPDEGTQRLRRMPTSAARSRSSSAASPRMDRTGMPEYRRTHTFPAACAHGAVAVLYYQGRDAVAGAALMPEAYRSGVPGGYISERVTRLLLRETGCTLEDVQEKLKKGPFPLPSGKRLRFEVEVKGPAQATGRNVLGMIRGSDPRLDGEIVLFGGHHDHIGRDANGLIHPGANDNASGTLRRDRGGARCGGIRMAAEADGLLRHLRRRRTGTARLAQDGRGSPLLARSHRRDAEPRHGGARGRRLRRRRRRADRRSLLRLARGTRFDVHRAIRRGTTPRRGKRLLPVRGEGRARHDGLEPRPAPSLPRHRGPRFGREARGPRPRGP